MSKYQHKTIFVFGASQGIGFAIASELVKQGANVHIFARRREALEEAAKQLVSLASSTQKVGCNIADVTNEHSVVAAISLAVDKIGVPPDIVINNAGAARPDYVENISSEQFLKTLTLNVLGTRNVAMASLGFLKQTKGHFVCTSSIAGFIGVFGYTDYCASKFAVIGFAEAFRAEVTPFGVAVSVIYPPDTMTEGFQEEEKFKPRETRAISGGNKLMAAEQVGVSVVKQLSSRKFHIFPSLEGKLSFWLKRFLPVILTFFMDRVISKAQKSM